MANKMELSRKGLSMAYGFLLVLFVLVTVTSAQITFGRQWVRGKYPTTSSEGDAQSSEFQRSAKAVFPKRDSPSRYARPAWNSEYVPVLMRGRILEEILQRVKEPSFGPSPFSSVEVNSKK